MKNKVIALLLAVVIASGSVGTVPAMAAETTAQEAAPVEEETVEEQPEEYQTEETEETVDIEDTSTGASTEEASEADAVVEMPEEEPVESVEESADADEQDLAVDTATTEETAVIEETEITESSGEADTSAETAEIEEPSIIEEEVVEVQGEEAKLAGDAAKSGSCGENATWTLTGPEDNLTLTISGSGNMRNYSAIYRSNTAPWEPYINTIRSLVVEEGITGIGVGCFISMEGLTSVSLPDSLISIDYGAFENCTSLSKVKFPQNVTDIGSYAFCDCSSISSITLPDKITVVGNNVFNGCSSLTSIVIPEGVTELESGAFANCTSLTSITIPENVTIIDTGAFNGSNPLANIYINDYDWWLNINAGDTYLSGDLYIKGKLLTEATIPEGMETIRKDAFRGCRSLKRVTIPDSVVHIDNGAFCGCSSLTSITIPDHVTRLGDSAFEKCSNLTGIVIPDGVTELGNSVFGNCDSLKSITIPDTVTSIGIYAFSWSDNLESVKLPKGLTSIDTGLFFKCKSLKDAVIPDYVTYIGSGAFASCDKLPDINIPDSVTSIGSCAFSKPGCIKIRVPDSVTSIDNYAFGTGNEMKADIFFCGTKEQWNAALVGNIVYNSITFNCFSVNADFKLSGTSFTYNGKALTPSVTVTYKGQQLVEGTDYKVTFANNTNAGAAKVYVSGIGNYSGTEPLTFTIKKASNNITAKNFTKTYSTKARSFTLGAKATGGTLTYASNNKKVTVSKAGKVTVKAKFIGKATITITAQNANYNKATKKITITINPTKTVLSSVKNSASKKMTVKWKKNAVGTGYQIQYSLKKNFKTVESVWITKNKTTSKTIAKLKKGKKYYVRIRTYKKVGKTKFYSGWSKTKAVTIKK